MGSIETICSDFKFVINLSMEAESLNIASSAPNFKKDPI